MIDDKYEKEYCLKLKDKELLTFNFSIEKETDGEVYNFLLNNLNKENKHLFPLNLELNSIGIQKWIEIKKLSIILLIKSFIYPYKYETVTKSL